MSLSSQPAAEAASPRQGTAQEGISPRLWAEARATRVAAATEYFILADWKFDCFFEKNKVVTFLGFESKTDLNVIANGIQDREN